MTKSYGILAPLVALASACVLSACGERTPQHVAQPQAAPQPAVAQPAPPDYQRARFSELHFKPHIDKASDQDCLACHAEVLKPTVREASPAGVQAANVKAWYQQTSTYEGGQDTFHRRHLETPLAKSLMNLRCNACHQGLDVREETSGSSATAQDGGYAMRKQVDPAATCLKCHGQMSWQVMGLPSPWETAKDAFQGNCLLCHAGIRTHRHKVSYLNAEAIEAAAQKNPETCFGCHGGRAWYRITYPYPRHPWPGMPEQVPDWAKDRPAESEVRFLTAGAEPKTP